LEQFNGVNLFGLFGHFYLTMEGIPSEWNVMLCMGSAAVAKRLWQARQPAAGMLSSNYILKAIFS